MTTTERRHVYRLIDLAVTRCEEANLREQLEVPRWVADLLVHLQAAGEEPRIPRDTIEAHGWLLDARVRYMPRVSSREVAEASRPAPRSVTRRVSADTAVGRSGRSGVGTALTVARPGA